MRLKTFTQKGERFPRWKIVSAAGLSMLLLLGESTPVLGNPQGGNVVAGSATITGAGNTVLINQGSHNAIINWQGFSINAGEVTRFVVPNSASATLNRVTGGNPSAIYGTLSSNGKVFLINPSGIIVGPTGRIDTHGFMGSTLDISNDEFMQGGNMHFLGNSDAKIDNQGSINATGGDVYLIAKQVDNNGTISAPHGNVGLAAGLDVLYQQAGDQHLFVRSTPLSSKRATGVTNAGTIRAASAELKAAGGNAYALAINNSGAIAATGYKKVNGQVYLTSDGGDITNSGRIVAKTADGNGGKIVLNGHGNATSGTVLNSGQLIASGKDAGKTGGTVNVLGNRVGITDSGVVDVSGDAGGGTALIGGDRHGDNPAIVNADQTYLSPDAQVIADAIKTGDGGKIILWGNQTTQAYGTISAKGGEISGNGGFVETSAANLDTRTAPNVSAPHGVNGTWLLDPTAVVITDGPNSGGTGTNGISPTPSAFTITSSSGNATLNQADLLLALQTGNVVIDGSTGSGAGPGTILWQQPNSTAFDIATIPGNSLTLKSPTQIELNGITILNSGSGSLTLVLNGSISGAGAVLVQNSAISLGGGSFSAAGNGYVSMLNNTYDPNGVEIFGSTINAQGGNIDLTGVGGYVNPGSLPLNVGSGIRISNGSVVETTNAGNINLNGSYSQPGSLDLDFVTGVDIENGNNLISVGAGTLSITGVVSQTYGSDTFSSETTAVTISQSSSLTATQVGGSITINGDASGAVSYDAGDDNGGSSGVEIGGDNFTPGNAVVSVVGGGTGISITGKSGIVHTNSISFTPNNAAGSNGIAINKSAQVVAGGTAAIKLIGTGGNIVVDSGNINTISIGVSLFSDGKSSPSNILVSSNSGGITIQGTAGSSPSLGVGVVVGGIAQPGGSAQGHVTLQSASGNIDITGNGGSGNAGPGAFPGLWFPNDGVAVFNSATISTSGALNIAGTGAITASGPDGLGFDVTEITNSNFDKSPTVPVINVGTLNIDTFGGSGISVQGNTHVGALNMDAASGALNTNDIHIFGTVIASSIAIFGGNNVSIDAGGSAGQTTVLGPVSAAGTFSMFADGNVTVNNTITANGFADIHAMGNLTLGPNAQIIQLGTPPAFGNTPNVGSILEAGQDFVNQSTFGANVFQGSKGGVYLIFAKNPASTVLGGLAPDYTLFGVTFNNSSNASFPPGNGLLYAAATLPPPPDNKPGNQAQATVTPQNNQVAPQPPPPQSTLPGGGSLVPVSFTGSGIAGQTGGVGGDLANSSGGSGSVASGDAAQMSQGELNNVTNPAASSALNDALSPLVFGTLTAALDSFGNEVSPGTGNTPEDNDPQKKHADNSDMQDLDSNDVVVIGGGGVKKIPLSQAPQQLQDALNNNTRSGLSNGAGH